MNMQQFRVFLERTITTECAVAVYADTPAEAERVALDVAPDDGRAWTVVNTEVRAQSEPNVTDR
jgi:hypothetical protein